MVICSCTNFCSVELTVRRYTLHFETMSASSSFIMRDILLALVLFVLVLDVILPSVDSATLQNSRKLKPSKQMADCFDKKEMDQIMATQYTFGNSGRKFPENLNELPEYCNTTDYLNRKLESFANECVMDSFTKSVIQILVHTIRHETRQFCRIAPNKRPTKSQAELLETAPCSNSLKDLHQTCINEAILFFQDSLSFKDPQQRLYYICCNMNKFEECVTAPMRDPASLGLESVCSTKHADVVLDFIQSVQGNMINKMCGDYSDDSSLCDKFKQTTPNSTEPAYKSLVVSMIDALTLFDYRFNQDAVDSLTTPLPEL